MFEADTADGFTLDTTGVIGAEWVYTPITAINPPASRSSHSAHLLPRCLLAGGCACDSGGGSSGGGGSGAGGGRGGDVIGGGGGGVGRVEEPRPFRAGDIVVITGIISRPGLNGQQVRLCCVLSLSWARLCTRPHPTLHS